MFKNPFILKLGSFLHQSPGYSREYPFEHDKVQFIEDFSLNNLEGLVNATRTQQGLLIQGDFEGNLTLNCVRCLEDYSHFLSWKITELYVFEGQEANEDELVLPANAQIDLGEAIADEALLDIPINPICKADCQGLCQACGANLNRGDCGHKDLPEEENVVEEEHSPFAGLKDLLD